MSTLQDEEPEATAPVVQPGRSLFGVLLGIFIILFVYALYFAKDFFLPVVLAFMLALTLSPIVRALSWRGVPAPLSATLLVFLSFCGVAVIGFVLSDPVVALVEDAPKIGRELQERLSEIKGPLSRLMQAGDQIESVTETANEPDVQKVVIAQPGIVSRAAGNLLSVGTTIAIMLVLSLFLLASGSMFYEKLVQTFDLMSDKKRALRIVYDVEREISRYLLTVALINAGLGVAVGLACLLLGLPNALLWGVAAALLNFLPYVGSLIGIVLVGVISIVTFDTLAAASLAPLLYAVFTVIEGQFLTPLILGRRLELNAVAIFIAIAFWSWLWGFAGALLAVPILVIVKVFCDHFDGLSSIGNFLGAQDTREAAD
ncbi:MAG: AI-2E family transporter [Mesorhizobium sp.]